MTFSKLNPILSTFLLGIALFITSCDKDDDNNNNNGSDGQLNVEITDGPSDDPNVKAVFVTVVGVKVNGENFSGFSGKKTINLMAYQQGDVALLGLGDIDAGTYNNITLVIDAEKDADGNSPGSYVQTTDNVKHALSATATHSLTVTKNFVVNAGQKTNVVIDFDLRKAVMYQGGGGSDHYDFVASADLQAALRLVVKEQTEEIKGSVDNSIVSTQKVVAYIYKKGTFNRITELQTEGGIAFSNAVSSAVVDSNGDFTIAFLESGDYEIHFAAYKDNNSDGKLDFQGTLIVNSLINLENLVLALNTSLDLNIMVVGILP